MRTILTSLVAACSLVATEVTASAQERGQAGVAMGYPASLAVIWHATDRLALKPDFTISKNSTENTTSRTSGVTSTSSTDAWATGFGLSALFYLSKSDNLSTYVTPRFGYSWTSIEGESTLQYGTQFSTDTKTTSTTLSVSGAFGAQYAVSRSFSVFGEVGLSYSDLHVETDPAAGESNGWGLGVRSSAGVILYF